MLRVLRQLISALEYPSSKNIRQCSDGRVYRSQIGCVILYWDKKTIFIEGTSTTSRAITHLEEVHLINEYGVIPEAANAPTTAAKPQTYGARQAATSTMTIVW